jgi:hypothetical protein
MGNAYPVPEEGKCPTWAKNKCEREYTEKMAACQDDYLFNEKRIERRASRCAARVTACVAAAFVAYTALALACMQIAHPVLSILCIIAAGLKYASNMCTCGNILISCQNTISEQRWQNLCDVNDCETNACIDRHACLLDHGCESNASCAYHHPPKPIARKQVDCYSEFFFLK